MRFGVNLGGNIPVYKSTVHLTSHQKVSRKDLEHSKMSSCLVFWEETPSSSVVNRSKVVGEPVIDSRRQVKWHKTHLWAKIIAAAKYYTSTVPSIPFYARPVNCLVS